MSRQYVVTAKVQVNLKTSSPVLFSLYWETQRKSTTLQTSD